MEGTSQLSEEQITHLQSWVVCIASVKFNIDLGQLIDEIYPSQSMLTTSELQQIAMLSFPDSNAVNKPEFTINYVFRLKRSKNSSHKYSYGFTYFLQRKDETNKRGYLQKAIVLLTNQPLLTFYSKVVQEIGQISFTLSENSNNNNNSNILLQACKQIAEWGLPQQNISYDLPLFGSNLNIFIHSTKDKDKAKEVILDNQDKSDIEFSDILNIQNQQSEGEFQEVNVYDLFQDKLHILWKLWQVVLTNQSCILIADTPDVCSQSIFGMISLISPLIYIGDFKPYFTIYDQEFKTIQQECEKKMVRNLMAGITNSFLLKSLKDFPVIVRLDQEFLREKKDRSLSKKPVNYVRFNKGYTLNLDIQVDQSVLKLLMEAKSEEIKAINNSILRNYFRNLTLGFLKVFDNYFKSQKNDIKIFDQNEFLSKLKSEKFEHLITIISNKSQIITLYERFIRSANFLHYIKSQGNVYFAKGKIKFSNL